MVSQLHGLSHDAYLTMPYSSLLNMQPFIEQNGIVQFLISQKVMHASALNYITEYRVISLAIRSTVRNVIYMKQTCWSRLHWNIPGYAISLPTYRYNIHNKNNNIYSNAYRLLYIIPVIIANTLSIIIMNKINHAII